MPSVMSGVFRLERTTILEIFRSNEPRFTAVASQLTKMVQKLGHDGALTWSGGMGFNLANPHDMNI